MKILSLGLAIFAIAICFLVNVDLKNIRYWFSDITMPIRQGIQRERGIMVPMRDGIRLSTTVYRPLSGNGPFPAILIRNTYGGFEFSHIKYFVKNGFYVVVQHVRGRYGSEGNSYSPHRYSRSDGYDTIDWIVKQQWSSGKVGTFGYSYLGESQIILAAARHPNHICMITDGAGGAIGSAEGSYGYFGVYENGVLNLASALGWFTEFGATGYKITPLPEDYQKKLTKHMNGLPVIDLAKRIVPYKTGFEDILSHDLQDEWWKGEGYIRQEDRFSTAGLHISTWYDQTVHDSFRLAKFMAQKAEHPRGMHQYLMIDPGNHSSAGKLVEGIVKIGEMEIEYKNIDFMKIYLDWFDYWLKDKKVDLPPVFKYFLINGASWKVSEKWPPVDTQVHRLYLHEDGRLADIKPEKSASGERSSLVDTFFSNPLDPVPTIGGPLCCIRSDMEISGAFDQRPLKDRKDVLIYISYKLKYDVDLVGNAKAFLYVSTSAEDTDFTLKIVDQQPNGKAYNLQDGVIRLRYREGIENPQLAKPDEIYRIELELRPIAYRFKKGHRIAVYISSTNFPRLARNLNTDKNPNKSMETKIATNRVYRNEIYPSYIELPLSGKLFSEITYPEQ